MEEAAGDNNSWVDFVKCSMDNQLIVKEEPVGLLLNPFFQDVEHLGVRLSGLVGQEEVDEWRISKIDVAV